MVRGWSITATFALAGIIYVQVSVVRVMGVSDNFWDESDDASHRVQVAEQGTPGGEYSSQLRTGHTHSANPAKLEEMDRQHLVEEKRSNRDQKMKTIEAPDPSAALTNDDSSKYPNPQLAARLSPAVDDIFGPHSISASSSPTVSASYWDIEGDTFTSFTQKRGQFQDDSPSHSLTPHVPENPTSLGLAASNTGAPSPQSSILMTLVPLAIVPNQNEARLNRLAPTKQTMVTSVDIGEETQQFPERTPKFTASVLSRSTFASVGTGLSANSSDSRNTASSREEEIKATLKPKAEVRQRILELDGGNQVERIVRGMVARVLAIFDGVSSGVRMAWRERLERREIVHTMRSCDRLKFNLVLLRRVSAALVYVLKVHELTERGAGRRIEPENVAIVARLLVDIDDLEKMLVDVKRNVLHRVANRLRAPNRKVQYPNYRDLFERLRRSTDGIRDVIHTIALQADAEFDNADPSDIPLLVFAGVALRDALEKHSGAQNHYQQIDRIHENPVGAGMIAVSVLMREIQDDALNIHKVLDNR